MRRLTIMKRLSLLVICVSAISACLGSDFGDSIQGAWELEEGTHQGESIPVLETHPITMNLEADQIGGTAACNAYGGRFRISGSKFSLTEGLSWTEMGCMPSEVMNSEQAFLAALTAVDTVAYDGDSLTMSGNGTELRFTALAPVPTAELTGTVWVLRGLIQGDAVSSAQGERATLELFTDSSFIGSTGCRTIAGNYVVTGAEVVFTDFSAEGECSAELANQDSQVISALEGGFRVEIDGDRMTTWVAGDEGLSYLAET